MLAGMEVVLGIQESPEMYTLYSYPSAEGMQEEGPGRADGLVTVGQSS